MNKTCTLEQAKRLKELGVEQLAEKYWNSSKFLVCRVISTTTPLKKYNRA